MAAALAVQAGTGEGKPLHERCPKLTAAERQEIEKAGKDRSVYFGLLWYAREECISLSEARRRMDIQLRDQKSPDSIGAVQTTLEQNESATFAGLWIQHQPTYRVVVAFTRGGSATLARYTRDPVFVAVDRGGPSLSELNATRERVARELHRLGARPSVSSVDVQRGRVTIGVVGDLTAFNAAVARGEVQLPPFVDIHPPGPLRHAAPPLPADWQKIVRAFPRAKYPSDGSEPDILRTGMVALENGCLRLVGERRNRVIVWPNEAALDLTTPGKVRVLNRRSGEAIEPGKQIDLGGDSGELAKDQEVIGADPSCPGPYFAMGNFGPLDPIDQAWIEGRATAFQQQRGISRAEALRLAREEKDREDRLIALGERLLREAPDAYAGVYSYQGRGTIKVATGKASKVRQLVPAELRPYVKIEEVPRPLAALKAERNAFLDDVERLGIEAYAYEDIERGRIVISSEDLAALGRAASAGQVRIPASARVQSRGGMPEGQYSQAHTEAADRLLEAVPDWDEMRALVEGTKVPGFLVTYKEGEPDRRPTPAQSLEITRFLVSLGFTAEDLRALHAERQFPAQAQVEQNGRATVANRALLAQEAIVGELLDVRPELLGDGFRSTARLRIVEVLKGDLRSGEVVEVRLVSGPGGDGKVHQSGDEPILAPGLPASLTPGSRWFMLLSEGYRARQGLRLGKTLPASSRRLFAVLYGAWPVAGSEVADTYIEPGLGRLEQVRRQLAPVDAAFDRASRRVGKPLMRRVVGVK